MSDRIVRPAEHNPGAPRFYLRQGYVETGRETMVRPACGVDIVDVRLERRIID